MCVYINLIDEIQRDKPGHGARPISPYELVGLTENHGSQCHICKAKRALRLSMPICKENVDIIEIIIPLC